MLPTYIIARDIIHEIKHQSSQQQTGTLICYKDDNNTLNAEDLNWTCSDSTSELLIQLLPQVTADHI